MIRPNIFLTLLLAIFLTACGGSGEDSVIGSTTTDDTTSDTTDDTTTDDTTTDDDTTVDVNLGLGSGTETDFVEGELSVSADYVLVGETITFTIYVVDKNDSNSALTDEYWFSFSSQCASEAEPLARFSTQQTYSSSGSVTTAYTNLGCDYTDVITISLYSSSTSTTALATASGNLPVIKPVLGYDSGPDFIDGFISGDLDLLDAATTQLTVNAVDPENSNALINSTRYDILWTSDCTDASFSIPDSTASGEVTTAYNANLTSCLGDNEVTASLVLSSDNSTVLDTATTTVTIAQSGESDDVLPALGNGTDESFINGRLTLSENKTVTGTSVTVSATAVDLNAANAQLSETSYLYVFSSTCSAMDPVASSFVRARQTTTSGAVSTSYTPSTTDCDGTDTITLKLYEAGANTDTATALATATVNLNVSIPVLGTGTGADFRLHEVSGDLELTDIDETVLTANAVNPGDSNSQVAGDEYSVVWTVSNCTSGSFSIESQDLSDGSISTRYDSSLTNCLGSNLLTLTLSWGDVVLDSMSVVVVLAQSNTVDETDLGLGSATGTSFVEGELALSAEYVLMSEAITISVYAVDKNDSNAVITDGYWYRFTSLCASEETPTARFSTSQTYSAAGSITTSYTNLGCDYTDVVTVSLLDSSDSVVALATATASIPVVTPVLGYGSGADYLDGSIDGDLSLTDEASTQLTVNAVDPEDSNALIDSSNYDVLWTSSCADASFSIPTAAASGEVVTSYNANLTSCLGINQITASLVLSSDHTAVLDTATATVVIARSGDSEDVLPALGNGTDESFINGRLSLSASKAVTGASVTVSATTVDLNASNAQLTDASYLYVFSSTCSAMDPVASAFENAEQVIASGSVSTVYTPTTTDCTGTDLITLQLYEAGADIQTATALATATASLTVAVPVLGTGTGADFRLHEVDGDLELIDVEETVLSANAVNPADSNSQITSEDYSVSWDLDSDYECEASAFSVASQDLSSGSISTRYNSSLATCPGNNELTLTLRWGEVELDSMSVIVVLADSDTNVDVNLGLGSGTGTEFVEGALSLSAEYVLEGDSVTVSVFAVDKNDSNSAVTDGYWYSFSSLCNDVTEPSTRFSTPKTYSSNGSVTSSYSNLSCNSTAEITVSLFERSDSVTAIATATADVPVIRPVLGYGSGSDYQDSVIDGDLELLDTRTTQLTINAADPESSNALIDSANYDIIWDSDCGADFSIDTSSTSGQVTTRYTYSGELSDCSDGDVITASLVLSTDHSAVLDTVQATISFTETTETEVSPALGNGTDESFISGRLSLSASNTITGTSITVSATAVDQNASNAQLSSDSYLYVFSSSCYNDGADAYFESRIQTLSSGSISSFYTPTATACNGVDKSTDTYSDTITLSLYDADTALDSIDAATPLATASASLTVAVPVLGIGTGADFRLHEVDGDLELTNLEETVLSAIAVNRADNNSQITGEDYNVNWDTDCGTGSFSVASQNLSGGTISTRYNSSLDACPDANTLTLTLYWENTELDSMEVVVDLQDEATSDEVEEAIGTGTGAEFFEGQLSLSAQQVLMGQTLTVTADGVDKNQANAQLTSEYKYVFSSSCSSMDPQQASFTITETNSSDNNVTSTYKNLSCTGEDTIRVTLYSANADTSDPTKILSTASQEIDVAAPALGFGEGSSFEDGTVDGEVDLAGEDETEFTVNLVNPLNSNSLVQSATYTAEWSSSCSDDSSFSVQKQTLSTGEINTRYSVDTEACLGTNSISLILYGTNAKDSCSFSATENCMDSLTFDVEVSQGVDPAIGYVDEDDNFYDGELLVYGYRVSDYDSMTEEELEAAKMSARGTALIQVSAVDLNDSSSIISGTSYGYVISSNCVDDGIASFEESEKITSSGTVTFTYTSDTCEYDEFEVKLYRVADDAMTTQITDTSASGVLYIQPIEIGAISYEGATDTAISISTIGDAVLPKQTTLTFLVVDESGDPVVSKTVEFELTNTAGGTSLSQTSDVTDSNGEVNVIINAGSAHGLTSVLATTVASDGATEISTYSQPISITTGLPDQDSFDLVVDLINPGAFDLAGIEVNVTVYSSDVHQNPVADGTIINFTAESGTIGSTCETSSGSCSVVWTSSGTRPGQHDDSLNRVNEVDPETGTTVYGMTTILAYTTGEAGFTDTNGNGLFDGYTTDELDTNGDGFVDQDANRDGVVDVDDNADGLVDQDLNSDGIVDLDENDDGYIDVDQDGDLSIDVDSNGDGIYDLDLNSDGDIDRDSNVDGYVDVDVNEDGIIDVDVHNGGDGFIDVDINSDGLVDEDVDDDGLVDVDLNGDGSPDKDENLDGYVDVDYNLDGNIDEDINEDGYIDEDDDSNGGIDPVDVNSMPFQAAVAYAEEVAFVDEVAIELTEIKAPVTYSAVAMVEEVPQAVEDPYVLYGEAFRDDDGLADVFRDTSVTGNIGDDDGYQSGEFFADFDSNGSRDEAPDSGYQGVTCSETSVSVGAGHCDSMMHVRDSVQIIQSVAQEAPVITYWIDDGAGDYLNVTATDLEAVMAGSASFSFYVLLQDTNGNMPANGTSLSVTGDGYEIYGETGEVGNSFGLLDWTNSNNLPTFGRLYSIQYIEDTDPVSIEISASYEDLTTGVTLFK